eukprot:6294157-Ditylum_brightwellii.AAC.1
MDFLNYHNRGKSDDMGPLSAWNDFKGLHIFNDCPDDNDEAETENDTDNDTPEEVIAKRKTAVQEFT